MVIAICDKEQQVRLELAKWIPTFTKEAYKIKEFADVEELFSYDGKLDMVIMDIGEKASNGMEIATRLREKSQAIPIFAAAKSGKEERAFTIKTLDGFQTIKIKDILYAENAARKIVLHTADSEFEYYEKMNCLQEQLGSGFFHCHRGYLVALSKVKGYDSREIELINGEKILLSRQKYPEFMQAYTDYMEKEVR